MLELNKAPFRGARVALEDLGVTAPDRLDREQFGRLTLQLADLEQFSAAPLGQPIEFINAVVASVALRFSAVYLVSPIGFWWRSLNCNPAAIATPAGVLFTLAPAAAAAGSFGLVKSTPTGVPSRVVVTGGDTVAAQPYSFRIPAPGAVFFDAWSWVAPGVTLAVVQQVAATSTELSIIVASPLER